MENDFSVLRQSENSITSDNAYSNQKAAFLPHIDGYICHQSLNGLTELRIPERVAELGVNAFAGTAIKSVTVPSSVVTVGGDGIHRMSEP